MLVLPGVDFKFVQNNPVDGHVKQWAGQDPNENDAREGAQDFDSSKAKVHFLSWSPRAQVRGDQANNEAAQVRQ